MLSQHRKWGPVKEPGFSSDRQNRKGKVPDSSTSWVNRAELKRGREREMGTDKKAVGAKEMAKYGRNEREWEGMEEGKSQRAGREQLDVPSSFPWPSILHPKLDNEDTPPPHLYLQPYDFTITQSWTESQTWRTKMDSIVNHIISRNWLPVN